ncbi:hypothetical protein [Bifidobacterium sp. ESL0745]|uniref:hypothetical protein n=1 Tax=Bifidobacterium sp. ESL0745 TaxID=2983226 RepID=UPI0023F98644|nr:hypothetical protein [Bifidobacterium sp. ESL0745]MDF7664508.1 hypothetical protein [Bifidobacterium sp. ESL0745]
MPSVGIVPNVGVVFGMSSGLEPFGVMSLNELADPSLLSLRKVRLVKYCSALMSVTRLGLCILICTTLFAFACVSVSVGDA